MQETRFVTNKADTLIKEYIKCQNHSKCCLGSRSVRVIFELKETQTRRYVFRNNNLLYFVSIYKLESVTLVKRF